MSRDRQFKFTAVKNMGPLLESVDRLSIDLKHKDNTGILFEKVKFPVGGGSDLVLTAKNRLAIHPMEGCDASANGDPTHLTYDRYKRFGRSGAAIVWFEATAVTPEGRANPRQLMINTGNVDKFAKIVDTLESNRQGIIEERDLDRDVFGDPIKILQLTHSGRYCRPEKAKYPYRAYTYEAADRAFGIDPDSGCIVSDDYLDELKEKYLQAIKHAKAAGFDGVDIKSCHRYLISELLSAFTRQGSKYGGPEYEDRTRFLLDIVRAAKTKHPDFLVTARLNIYDGLPHPYGFGVSKESESEPPEPDPTEPIRLIKDLNKLGVFLINFTVGNPYFKPYLSRPYDIPSYGAPNPPEHPLKSIERVVNVERAVNTKIPESVKTIGTAFSWLRQWAPKFAAGEIKRGSFDFIGFGRMSFANPEFPIQIYKNGVIDKAKTCITCSKCTDLMRFDSTSGCPIRHSRKYAKIYGKARREFKKDQK